MSANAVDYSFQGLLHPIGEIKEGQFSPRKSLCYLIGLADSADHKISETLPAKHILSWLYDVEDQAADWERLKYQQEFFDHYFSGGYYPKTPCMVVNSWSPISALLEAGIEPRILRRDPKARATATGIWDPPTGIQAGEIESAKTDRDLFWTILKRVSVLALEERKWVSIIAATGWSHEMAINSLPAWPADEVSKSGRVLWKRTPQG
jgi:hypothetical protein